MIRWIVTAWNRDKQSDEQTHFPIYKICEYSNIYDPFLKPHTVTRLTLLKYHILKENILKL